MPHWDPVRRQLWLGDHLVRQFGRHAPSQMAVLDACQAAAWAGGHVARPLPPEPGETDDEYRRRVHEAVRNLNEGVKFGTLRFHQDGAGTGVWWEFGGTREAHSRTF